ncbi:hypothetical protein [Streptomyces sp. NPDC056061]|uniref:hypothetical protein n=1 Tax=Streptomyces sp. NPDC056061 TaxID=3345700 RepID=UPI0035D7409A
MGGAEAQKRLLALLTAAAFIADRMRAPARARIEDDGASPELTSAMEKLTAPQITDSINRALETNSSLLDEETSAEFMKIFGGGRIVAGRYVPLQYEEIREALRLTGGRGLCRRCSRRFVSTSPPAAGIGAPHPLFCFEEPSVSANSRG